MGAEDDVADGRVVLGLLGVGSHVKRAGWYLPVVYKIKQENKTTV